MTPSRAYALDPSEVMISLVGEGRARAVRLLIGDTILVLPPAKASALSDTLRCLADLARMA